MNEADQCHRCGNPMRSVWISGQPSGESICLICNPTNGNCPRCKSQLRTNKAQQCPRCYASWHSANTTEPINPTVTSVPITNISGTEQPTVSLPLDPLDPQAGDITFTCPKCTQTANVSFLGRYAKTAAGPPPSVGLFNISGKVPEKRGEAGLVPVTCPHCQQAYPCNEVLDLKGAVLWNCPKCKHQMLSSKIYVGSFLSCEICGGCFTGGAIRSFKGHIDAFANHMTEPEVNEPVVHAINRIWSNGQEPAVKEPPPGRLSIKVPFQCKQETHQTAGNIHDVRLYPFAITVGQPDTGVKSYRQYCPNCDRDCTVVVESYQVVHARMKKLATVGVVGLPVFFGVFLYAIIATGTNGLSFSAWEKAAFACSLICLVVGLVSLVYLIPSWRAKLVTAASCIKMYGCSEFKSTVWQQRGGWDDTLKVATLAVSHELLTDNIKHIEAEDMHFSTGGSIEDQE